MWGNRRVEIAKSYLLAIWGGDFTTCDSLMTADVRFIDSLGERLEGFAACSSAARVFHRLEPDCRVEVAEAFERDGSVMIRANLEARDPRLRGPYLINIKLRGDRVCEWQTHRRRPVAYSRVLRRESAQAG